MRRRNHYGYGAYRGKSKFRTFLKFLIAVLAVVLVLLVAAFFFLQRYMVVSSTGGIYFDLPFLNREEISPSPSGSEETPSIVVVSPSPELTPSPSPEPDPVYTRAVALPDSLISGGGVQNLYAAGGEASADVSVAWSDDEGLVSQATGILEAYRDHTDARVATSGYLDLKGNVWGAIVRDIRWVDVVLVRADAEDASSTAQVVRLRPGAMDEGY